jgi:hypothetical protein
VSSRTITIPPEVAFSVRVALHNQLGLAAEELADRCQTAAERPRSFYEDAFACLDSSRALLEQLGYETPIQPTEIEITPAEHRWMLLKALREQHRAEVELLDEMNQPDRDVAAQRTQSLQQLIDAASWDM